MIVSSVTNGTGDFGSTSKHPKLIYLMLNTTHFDSLSRSIDEYSYDIPKSKL